MKIAPSFAGHEVEPLGTELQGPEEPRWPPACCPHTFILGFTIVPACFDSLHTACLAAHSACTGMAAAGAALCKSPAAGPQWYLLAKHPTISLPFEISLLPAGHPCPVLQRAGSRRWWRRQRPVWRGRGGRGGVPPPGPPGGDVQGDTGKWGCNRREDVKNLVGGLEPRRCCCAFGLWTWRAGAGFGG